MNRENLKRMADYIETIPQEMFDMEMYRYGESTRKKCNSVGCVIGHCTILDKGELPKAYGEIAFGKWSAIFTGVNVRSPEGRYLFSCQWSDVDNTPTGAAKRIRYFLEHGLPETWAMEMRGNAPLSYEND